jgi:hypothetical protein
MKMTRVHISNTDDGVSPREISESFLEALRTSCHTHHAVVTYRVPEEGLFLAVLVGAEEDINVTEARFEANGSTPRLALSFSDITPDTLANAFFICTDPDQYAGLVETTMWGIESYIARYRESLLEGARPSVCFIEPWVGLPIEVEA